MKALCGCLLTFFLGVGSVSVLSSAQSVNVTTWHNDNWRTGQEHARRMLIRIASVTSVNRR